MPWQTPTLDELRALNRDNVTAQLGSGPIIPNSVMRVMADSNAGLGFLALLYLDWLSRQLLPDTAEADWLARHGDIWRPGGQGKKAATFASASVTITGINGTPIPSGTEFLAEIGFGNTALFQTTALVNLGALPTADAVVSLTPGVTGLTVGSTMTFVVGIAGVNGSVTVASITDGINEETDDELRVRVLDRIREPPAGGDASDFVAWAKATPGVNVTRAWCSPLEMGIGTVTIRFMTDDVVNGIVGFPSAADVTTVQTYIDTIRPVAIKDRFVVPPIPEPIDLTISNLSPDTVAVRSAIAKSIAKMLFDRASPAHAVNGKSQLATTIYSAWVSDAINDVAGVDTFTLTMADHPMPYPASLAVLGTVIYG